MEVALTQYRIYCTDGDGYLEQWLDHEPTCCFLNPAHAIDASQTVIKKTIGKKELVTDDDNRLVVAPSLMPDTYTGQFMGLGDDYANGVRGGGSRVFASMDSGGASESTMIAYTIDVVLALGCKVSAHGGNWDDYFSIIVVAPASPVVANGSTTGNCNLVPVGAGKNIIIPNPVGNGTHDVNLTEPMNANLAGPDPVFISKVVPVPAEDISGNITTYNGYWDYNEATGEITPSPTVTGKYNLFDFEIPLVRWVNKWPIWTEGGVMYEHEFFIHNKGAKLLPHWYLAITTTRAASHDVLDPPVKYMFSFYVARKRTV